MKINNMFICSTHAVHQKEKSKFLFALGESTLVDKPILPAYTSKLNFFENFELHVGKILWFSEKGRDFLQYWCVYL